MGQLTSFERLALPHLDAAFNLAFWLMRSETDAEDIVQDTFMRAFCGLHGFAANDRAHRKIAILAVEHGPRKNRLVFTGAKRQPISPNTTSQQSVHASRRVGNRPSNQNGRMSLVTNL